MKQLPIVVLKGCSFVGRSLSRLCLPSAFGGKAEFDVNAYHIFPQGVLVAITLLGGVAGDEGARACAKFEASLPLLCGHQCPA